MSRSVVLALALASTACGCLSTPSPAVPPPCATGFEGDGFTDTVVEGSGALVLDGTAAQGFYESPIADAGEPRAWALSWTPAIASLRSLPGDGGADVDYPSTVDMSGNLALYHLDEPDGSSTIEDHAGNELSAGCSGAACPELDVEGVVFGRGAQFGADTRMFRGTTALLEPDAFSIEVWARRTGVHGTGTLGATGILVAKGAHLADDPFTSWALEQAENTGKEPTRALRCYLGHVDTGVTARGSLQPDAASNFHGVCTFDGEMLRLYVNGAPDASEDVTMPIDYALGGADTDLSIGTYGVNNQDFTGVIDEVAIYDRALDPDEVRLRWLRGALRVMFQVRSCDDPACEGDDFVGPSGDDTTFFTERCRTEPGPPRDLATADLDCDGDEIPDDAEGTAVPARQYGQFRIRLETADPDETPRVLDAALCPLD